MKVASHKKALAVAGRANVGKSTLIEKMIVRLSTLGLRLAVIKHASHGFHLTPGKDSSRFFDAGARTVWVVSERMGTLRVSREPMKDLEGLISELLQEADLVVLEGYKNYPLPQVWVLQDPSEIPPLEGYLPKLLVGPFERPQDAAPTISEETIERTTRWIFQTLAISPPYEIPGEP
jgi:molybdopterin-guanine dinucleotide biosynthesis protein MobB